VASDGQADVVNRLAKLHDWADRLRITEQPEVRFRSNQTDLSSPSKKRFPVSQQLVGPLGQVFSCRIAEIECQMSTDLMGYQIARDERACSASGMSAVRDCHRRLWPGYLPHQPHITI